MLRSSFAAPTSATIDDLGDPVLQSEKGDADHRTSLTSIGLIVLSTISGAAAQILLRFGAEGLNEGGLAGLITNFPLIGGYALLGLNVVLVVLAFRHGQLSVLYPIIALTFVWVTVLAPTYFGDVISTSQIVGLALIVAGVSCIGAGSRS